MADEQQVQVKLQELFLASRKLRFLHLKSEEELIFTAKLCGEHKPLFLGADVLSNCSIAVSNLPRTHAKFAKKGLAMKVNFPSFLRITGIQGTGKGVWFYSIQGLFRVAFEMYPREEQLDLLKCLQSVWTLRFGDQLLREIVNPLRFDLCENRREEMNVEKVDSDGKEVPLSVTNSSQCSTNQNTCYANASQEITKTVLEEQNSENDIENVQKQQLHHWKYEDILPELTDLMRTCDNSKSRSEFDAIVTSLRTLLQSYKSLTSEHSPMDHQQKFLYATSYWVGNEFSKYKEEISQKVIEFKKRHIAAIDSLPPAERVIMELFPQPMIVLLKTWMKDETQKPQTFLPFPLIQLILEFANQTLVSGVAHVLYSRLIRSESV